MQNGVHFRETGENCAAKTIQSVGDSKKIYYVDLPSPLRANLGKATIIKHMGGRGEFRNPSPIPKQNSNKM